MLISQQTQQVTIASPKRQHSKKEKSIDRLAETFIKDSSERNFFNLFSRIKWGLRSYIYNIVGDNNGVDDVMSRTLEQIYYNRSMFKNDIAKFSTWMYKIAYNNSIKYINDMNIYGARLNLVDGDISDIYECNIYESTDLDQDSDIPGGYTEDCDLDILFGDDECILYSKEKIFSEIYDASIDCMQYLPDNCRFVMKERYIDKKNVVDIARDNNLSLFDVKNWLVKARKLLRNEVQNRYADLYEVFQNSKIVD